MPAPILTSALTSDRVAPPRLQLLSMTGDGVAEFMQNYVTLDILGTPEGAIGIGACCNRQGRVLADIDLFRNGEQLYLVLTASTAPHLERHLAPYLGLSKISLEVCELHARWLALGDLPTGLPVPEPGQVLKQDDALLARYATSPDWVLCWQPPCQQPEESAPTFARWWHNEVTAGRVRITPELSEKFLPQALGFDALGGISYDKGCYLGQEIVARAHYRGSLKQSLKRIRAEGDWQTDATLQIGANVLDETGRKVGVLATIAGATESRATLLAVMREVSADTSVILKDSSLTLSLLE